jgi:hypothetical protein
MSIRDDLKAFVDGELTPSREAEIRQAIENDPALQAEVVELRQMSRALRAFAVAPEPVGMESTLLALAQHERRTRPWYMGRRFTVGVGLAASVVLAIAMLPRLGAQSDASDFGTRSSVTMARTQRDGAAKAGADREAVTDTSSPSVEVPLEDTDAKQQSFEEKSKGRAAGGGAPAAAAEATGANVPAARDGIVAGLPTLQADVILEVSDIDATVKALRGLAPLKAQEQRKSETDARESATVVLTVPSAQQDAALKRIKAMGRVINQSTGKQDLYEKISDVAAQIAALRSEEEQYVHMLRKTHDVDEQLSIRAKLSEVRQKIGHVARGKGRLEEQADTATIRVRLRRAPRQGNEQANWTDGAWRDATSRLGGFGRAVGSGAIYALVFAPVWAPAAGFTWWLIRRK